MMLSQTIHTAIGTLHYAVGPAHGPPLLLLHGVTRRWQDFMPLLPTLLPHWQIVGLDFRGHGASQHVPHQYRVVDYVHDAAACLKELDRPAVIFGHSLGAMVGAALAASAPESVRGLILEDPPMHTMGQRIQASMLFDFFRGMQRFAGDTRSVREIATDLAEIPLTDPRHGKTMRLGSLRDQSSLRFTASCLKRMDPTVLDPIIGGEWLNGFNSSRIFAQIECPTLLFQADVRAGGMLTDEDADQIERLARDLVRVRFPNVGHLIHWTQTQPLVNSLLGFLASL